jgi:hypothetical protein
MTGILNEAEDVIPPPAIQTCRMISWFKQHFIHFEGRGKRPDKN